MKRLKSLLAVTSIALSSNLFAHGVMHETFPSNGASMTDPTDRIELTFKNPTKLVSLKLVDGANSPMPIKFERSQEAATHFESMFPALQQGTYSVHWKAMGTDGHMMKGSFEFEQQ